MNDNFNKNVQVALQIIAHAYKTDDQLLKLGRMYQKYWDLLDAIKSDRQKAIDLGKKMLASSVTHERCFAVTLLGQVCNPVQVGEEADAENIIGWLSALVENEKAVVCLEASAYALSFPWRISAAPALLKLSYNANDDIRYAATTGFGALTGDRRLHKVTRRLIELSTDKDADIRDWATMHLGSVENCNEAVRIALIARLKDRHFDTRSEAIAALAKRGDPAALLVLKKMLSGEVAGTLAIEAAGDYSLPELHEYLDKWAESGFGYLYEWARKRCDADIKIKDSVDDEWIGDEWYVNVKNGVRRPLKYKEGDYIRDDE